MDGSMRSKAFDVQAEFDGNGFHQFITVHHRIHDERRGIMAVKLFEAARGTTWFCPRRLRR